MFPLHRVKLFDHGHPGTIEFEGIVNQGLVFLWQYKPSPGLIDTAMDHTLGTLPRWGALQGEVKEGFPEQVALDLALGPRG